MSNSPEVTFHVSFYINATKVGQFSPGIVEENNWNIQTTNPDR